MSNSIIANAIKDKINSLEIDDNAIVVLKGIPLSIVEEGTVIDLASVIDNKMGYFMSIYKKRKYLTYEEFLLMADFVISQYKEVYILNNNI